ncbi:MAG: hypothetical protein QOE30_1949 [Mycobacterium sp.]|nr:hypothetical protein [Mycobacterium sp.]
MDFSVIGPIIGGLGIGSLITQYLMAGRSRREVRGAVLKQLAEVEEARWAGGPDDPDYRAFQKALHALETAALIARIPRRAVIHYAVFAHVARWMTQDYLDSPSYDEEVGPLLFNPVANVVTGAAQTVTRLVWSPTTGPSPRRGRADLPAVNRWRCLSAGVAGPQGLDLVRSRGGCASPASPRASGAP